MLFLRQFAFSFYQLSKQIFLFFIALIFCISLFCILTHQYIYFFFLLPLLLTGYFSLKRLAWYAIALVISLVYAISIQIPKEQTIHGKSIVQIVNLSSSGKKIQGKILSNDAMEITTPILCMITTKKMPKHFSAKNIYEIEGKLIVKKLQPSVLIPSGNLWKVHQKTYNLVDFRFSIKQSIEHFMKNKIKSFFASNLLSSLITGNSPDPYIRYIFAKAGLQHILAISGFHFALITMFLFYVLRYCLPLPWVYICLIVFSNLYYVYLGNSPSIERAWIMTELYLFSRLFNKRYFSLNALGCACLIEIGKNPLSIFSLGFQLSYLSCCFLILFFPLIYKQLHRLFPENTYFAVFLKNSFSLSISVNIAIIPFLLSFSHYFPLYSFFYNFLIPPLIMPILLLFFLATITIWVPLLSNALFFLLNLFTTILIKFITLSPYSANIYCKNITKQQIIIYLILLLYWGMNKRVLPFFQKIV